MNNWKLQVIRFGGNDVIATSDVCPLAESHVEHVQIIGLDDNNDYVSVGVYTWSDGEWLYNQDGLGRAYFDEADIAEYNWFTYDMGSEKYIRCIGSHDALSQ